MTDTTRYEYGVLYCTHQIGPDNWCNEEAPWVEVEFMDEEGLMRPNWRGAAWCDEHRPTEASNNKTN